MIGNLRYPWRKSSFSDGGGEGSCVEVAGTDSAVLVRDTKLGDDSPILAVGYSAWTDFITTIRTGEMSRSQG